MSLQPQGDLPFSPEVVSYIAEGLRIAELTPDPAWLVEGPLDRRRTPMLLARGDVYTHLRHARRAVPRSYRNWELASFYQAAIEPAAFDLSTGLVDDFRAFRFLYMRLLGKDAADWLPSLYLAAASLPSIDVAHRTKLIGRFAPEFLDRGY